MEDDIVVHLKNGRQITIAEEAFQNMDFDALKKNMRAVFMDNAPMGAVFAHNPVAGMQVVHRQVFETPNPWPRVVLIMSGFALVVWLSYNLLR